MRKRDLFSSGMGGNLPGVVAGGFLVIYIVFLLGTNYLSQREIEKTTQDLLNHDAEKLAAAVSYFFSERKADLVDLAGQREISAYFANKALGMPETYSVQAGLFEIKNSFIRLMGRKKLGDESIYKRVVFIDPSGHLLVDSQSAGMGQQEERDWKALLTPGAIEPAVSSEHYRGEPGIVVSVPYSFNEIFSGQIVAWVSPETVADRLLNVKVPYSRLFVDIVHGMSHYTMSTAGHLDPALYDLPEETGIPHRFWVKLKDGVKEEMVSIRVPVEQTPFSLITVVPAAGMLGKTAPWRLFLSMGLITAIILGGTVLLVRVSVQKQVLKARLVETSRREQEVEDKNSELERQISQRIRVEEELRALHHDLEARIEERTRELHTSNELLRNEILGHGRARQALGEQLNFLHRLVDTIPSPIFAEDPDGLFTGCNSAFETLAGRPGEEIIGKTVYDIFPKVEAEICFKKSRELLSRPGTMSYDATVTYADGSRHDVIISKATFSHIDGKTAGIVGVMTDLTESKRNQAQRTLLAAAVGQAPESVIITDARRAVIYVNPAFERVSGYKAQELRGQKLGVLRSEFHDEVFYRNMKETLDRGEVWTGYVINKRKDGTTFEVESTISPVRDDSGTVTNYIAVGRDVTRERKLEGQLRQMQKLDALGTLAGGVAHDFNNILTAIMGYVELELNNAAEGSHTRRRMEQAHKACCRARDLVKQILVFSRRGEYGRKPVAIGSVVEDALAMLRATLPSTITVRQNLEAGRALILGDPTQIHQVIINLGANAAHAMRENGGVLEVALVTVDLDAEAALCHLDLRAGPYVRLTVSDSGQGMERDILERIFEPFFTTKLKGEGTGMGLSVVHGIVKSHGGAISVYSEPGKGTTVQVFLPRTDACTIPRKGPSAPPPTGRETLLLVDDEEMVLNVGSQMLESLGYDVATARDAHDALSRFRAQPDRFDLVITDQTMPHMTGTELAVELLRIRHNVRIVLCTGFASPVLNEKAVDAGVRKVIMKPFVLHELAEAVRCTLDENR